MGCARSSTSRPWRAAARDCRPRPCWAASSSWSSPSTRPRASPSRASCARWAFATPAGIGRRTWTFIARGASTWCSTASRTAPPRSISNCTAPRFAPWPCGWTTPSASSPGAKTLLYPDWQERVGEGERHIPAVRAPDGTLVYLVEAEASGRSIWEDDFELPDDGPGQGRAGLDAVDHVAHGLPFGRMDTYVLFWRALFGLEPDQRWVSPDPYGLIQSKAMINPDRNVRLSLNV